MILRYSTAPIDETNFYSATQVPDPPIPKSSGQTESFRVYGLQPSTVYYFAIKVIDEQGNISGISNVALATTLGPPSMALNPYLISDTLCWF